MQHSIKVQVIKETSNRVYLRFVNLNRKMPIPKADFEKRVENGVYEVL